VQAAPESAGDRRSDAIVHERKKKYGDKALKG
jgi:hypothetical protein